MKLGMFAFLAGTKAKNAPRHEAGARREAGRGAVFFHPDCDRRLRHSTGSADPPLRWRRSRARVGCRGQDLAYRRWGIAPRPEDVTNCDADEPAGHSNTRVLRQLPAGAGCSVSCACRAEPCCSCGRRRTTRRIRIAAHLWRRACAVRVGASRHRVGTGTTEAKQYWSLQDRAG